MIRQLAELRAKTASRPFQPNIAAVEGLAVQPSARGEFSRSRAALTRGRTNELRTDMKALESYIRSLKLEPKRLKSTGHVTGQVTPISHHVNV